MRIHKFNQLNESEPDAIHDGKPSPSYTNKCQLNTHRLKIKVIWMDIGRIITRITTLLPVHVLTLNCKLISIHSCPRGPFIYYLSYTKIIRCSHENPTKESSFLQTNSSRIPRWIGNCLSSLYSWYITDFLLM